jgi:serine/threonine protein kinase
MIARPYTKDGGGDTLSTTSRIYQKDLVVHRTLGMGRFGRVRLVQHNQTGKTYALKMMARRLIVEAGQESHLRNEVTVMKRISHPFCTNLLATYVDSRYFYMLLEVTSGGELFRVLEQAPGGYLSNSASCFYAANVVCAFEYLHKQKITYRDLKPENLLVDAHGYLKLVDFGFAKRVYGRTYTMCGTADYLAPEIVSHQGHGFEVDLWALGVLSYEMLVGYPPFEGDQKVGGFTRLIIIIPPCAASRKL